MLDATAVPVTIRDPDFPEFHGHPDGPGAYWHAHPESDPGSHQHPDPNDLTITAAADD